jgi:YD repeat-containing protein
MDTRTRLNGVHQPNDPLGTVTTVANDCLGRMTRLVNPDAGTWTYRYTDANRQAAGLSTGNWTDGTLTTASRIRAVHFTELRQRIAEWRSATGRGSTPEFTAGPIVATTRPVRLSDYNDPLTWLGQSPPPPPPPPPANASASCQEFTAPTGSATTLATYFYDEGGAAANALGRRTRLTDASGSTTWSYDAAGGVSQQQTILGSSYTTAYGYDALDRVVRLTLPDGERVATSYGLHGLALSLTGTDSYVSSATYPALLQPTHRLGNGASADFEEYDTHRTSPT